MAEQTEVAPQQYLLAPPPRSGLLSLMEGWRFYSTLGTGLVCIGIMMLGHPFVAIGVFLAVSTYLLAKRKRAYVSDLVPLGAGLGTKALTGKLRTRSGSELSGHDALTGKALQSVLPVSLKGVTVESVETSRGAQVGVGVRGRFYTAALRVTGEGIIMEDETDQIATLRKYGSIQDGFAVDSSPIRDLRWVEIAVPEDPNAIRQYFEDHHTTRPGSDRILRNYGAIVQRSKEYSPSTVHELYVMITIDTSNPVARKAIRRANKKDKHEGAKDVLLQQLIHLRSNLQKAGWTVHHAMSPGMIGRAVREAYAPNERSARKEADRHAGRVLPLDLGNAIPQEEQLLLRDSCYITDGVYHRSYYIDGWPRNAVGTDWFGALVLQTGCMRRIAVHMKVTPQSRALSQVRRRRSNLRGDARVREKTKYESTEEHDMQEQAVDRQAAHVASGHALYSVAGTITISAYSLEELEKADAEIHMKAALAGISLQTCFGRQDAAFARTLFFGI